MVRAPEQDRPFVHVGITAAGLEDQIAELVSEIVGVLVGAGPWRASDATGNTAARAANGSVILRSEGLSDTRFPHPRINP